MTTPSAPNGNEPQIWCISGGSSGATRVRRRTFQKLFENAIKRAHPEFMQTGPYGKIGDRKCDGPFFEDGVVF